MNDAQPSPTGALVVIPSVLAAGEEFSLKLKLRGEAREIPPKSAWQTAKPALRGPFNRNVSRDIRYHDDCLETFAGALRVVGDGPLKGPETIHFDGGNQGTFPGDTRPIGGFGGFCFAEPGIHFVRVIHESSGLEVWSNPCCVTAGSPAERLYWGDPHWQTFFSDGIRCPEELYAFARDEAFLDFGAISDHNEAVTDRQWDYYQLVTNDYNEPGRFATLVGLEWTNHNPAAGVPGHRNIYVRGESCPPLRSNDPECNTLEKLWRQLDRLPAGEVIAIPHHPANAKMGVDFSLGWNATYEKAIEIYSIWGSSEKSAEDGNPRPILNVGGEKAGQHVRDALARGYRFGFVGGGDIHDGRGGDDLNFEANPKVVGLNYRQGFTAAWAPQLSRETVFDALRDRRTYATTRRRIYLDARRVEDGRMSVRAACEDGGLRAVRVKNGEETLAAETDGDGRRLEASVDVGTLAEGEYAYIRIETAEGEMAWSSPIWG